MEMATMTGWMRRPKRPRGKGVRALSAALTGLSLLLTWEVTALAWHVASSPEAARAAGAAAGSFALYSACQDRTQALGQQAMDHPSDQAWERYNGARASCVAGDSGAVLDQKKARLYVEPVRGEGLSGPLMCWRRWGGASAARRWRRRR